VGFFELFMIAVGLSMDAFAVAVCKGLGMRRLSFSRAAIIAAFFGFFQAFMPVVGWALGSQFAQLVEPIDHWIAFGLLAFIGGKMIWDAFMYHAVIIVVTYLCYLFHFLPTNGCIGEHIVLISSVISDII
jgi:putative Mn2+ efflux pump MntP